MIIKVNLPQEAYDIVIRQGILADVGKELNLNRRVLVVTDDGVPKEYAERVIKASKYAVLGTIKHGENHKSLESFSMLQKLMLDNGFTRKDCVVAVGGGIVGDLAGYVAASYMRGIDFYNIPTTVLSQVDSSVGGKTGVNFGGVKNIVGAFWQPKKVLIDPLVLNTLPKRQISNGLSEAIKMSLTSDRKMFERIEEKQSFDSLDDIEAVIADAIKIKADVVEKDEKEMGLRKVLNFGHTLGHGIEMAAGGKLYHGECVGLGMLAMCDKEVGNRLLPVLERLNLPIKCEVDIEKTIEAVSHDKKSGNEGIATVYVKEIGDFEFRNMTLDMLEERLKKIIK